MSIQHLELLGLCRGLATAAEIVIGWDLRGVRIRIFTDSRNCLEYINKLIRRNWYNNEKNYVMGYISPILDKMVELSRMLDDMDCRIELRWVKRNQMGLHFEADHIAKEARTEPDWKNPPNSFGIAEVNEQVVSLAKGRIDLQWFNWRVARLAELHERLLNGNQVIKNPNKVAKSTRRRNRADFSKMSAEISKLEASLLADGASER